MSIWAWLRGAFTRQKAIEPRPGELWEFTPKQEGPWPVKRYKPVTVLDVASGWVRYSIDEGFDDCRATVDSFVSMYTRVDGGGK